MYANQTELKHRKKTEGLSPLKKGLSSPLRRIAGLYQPSLATTSSPDENTDLEKLNQKLIHETESELMDRNFISFQGKRAKRNSGTAWVDFFEFQEADRKKGCIASLMIQQQSLQFKSMLRAKNDQEIEAIESGKKHSYKTAGYLNFMKSIGKDQPTPCRPVQIVNDAPEGDSLPAIQKIITNSTLASSSDKPSGNSLVASASTSKLPNLFSPKGKQTLACAAESSGSNSLSKSQSHKLFQPQKSIASKKMTTSITLAVPRSTFPIIRT